MTGRYILYKDHLRGFLRKLGRMGSLIAPVSTLQGDVLLQEVDSVDSFDIELSTQPQNSPKAIIFPQYEVLFEYTIDKDGRYRFKERIHGDPLIFFAIRPCDLSAILYLDVKFLQRPRDPYYLKRRADSVMIVLGCNDPGENCFCNSTGTGPFLQFGYDLQLTDLGDRFFVETGRVKGEEIVSRWPQFFRPATQEDVRQQYQKSLEARTSFKRTVHVEAAFRIMEQGRLDERIWKDIAIRCHGCGGCAYVCPTCACFTIEDRPRDKGIGERVRMWDACTHHGFTRLAGGVNPVDVMSDVLRQRFMHKLFYDYKRFGRPGCVGCGRCVDICFGGADIVSFVSTLVSTEVVYGT